MRDEYSAGLPPKVLKGTGRKKTLGRDVPMLPTFQRSMPAFFLPTITPGMSVLLGNGILIPGQTEQRQDSMSARARPCFAPKLLSVVLVEWGNLHFPCPSQSLLCVVLIDALARKALLPKGRPTDFANYSAPHERNASSSISDHGADHRSCPSMNVRTSYAGIPKMN